MRPEAIIYAIGQSGLFPARAFLPAFLTALLFRFGHSIPIIRGSGILDSGEPVEAWFTHDITLCIFAVLSILECWATKNPDIRALLDLVDDKVKAVVSLFMSLGVLDAVNADLINAFTGASLGSVTLAAGCAGGTYAMSKVRQDVSEWFSHSDPDDSLGIQRLVSWAVDGWVIFALFLLVLIPLTMLFLSSLVFIGLILVRKYLQSLEEKTKVACVGCATRIFPSAIVCCKCKRELERPCAVGFFGQLQPMVPADMAVHRFRLIEFGRCPACSSRFTADRDCPACGLRLAEERAVIDRYVQFVDGRQRTVLPICFFLSLLPIVGAIPAIVYYRLTLVAPYQRHLSRSHRLIYRWQVRLINLGLLAFHWIPGLGGLSIPLMAISSHRRFRSAFRLQFERATLGDAPTTTR